MCRSGAQRWCHLGSIVSKYLLIVFGLILAISLATGPSKSSPALAGGPSARHRDAARQDEQAANRFALSTIDSLSLQRWAGGYLSSRLEPTVLDLVQQDYVRLRRTPNFSTIFSEQFAAMTPRQEVVFFTLDPEFQHYVKSLVKGAKTSHVAIVAMEPHSGKILAAASKSRLYSDLVTHSEFPAASLFKLVTAGAALQYSGMRPSERIYYRGGMYTLGQWNYQPDYKKDRHWLTARDALGKSCNPAFGRIALKYLNRQVLQTSAEQFGFNGPLGFDVSLSPSKAYIPADDLGLSLTAAGFGKVTLSPVHAAALTAGIANGGAMPRPYMIDRIISPSGKVLYAARPRILKRMLSQESSQRLLEMMEATTTSGTSRSAFMRKNRPVIPSLRVAAKTGTLSGSSPKGVNHWFVAAAPLTYPSIAIAIVVVDPSGVSSKASHLGRSVLQKFFELQRKQA